MKKLGLRTASLLLSSASLFAMTACTTPPAPAAAGASLPLEGTHWRLASLGGQAVPTPAGVREIYLMLDGGQRRASGFAGCNQFFAGYTLNGSTLRFERPGATLMACPALAQEQSYLNALTTTASWRVSGERLQLLDGQGRAQAEFTARAPR